MGRAKDYPYIRAWGRAMHSNWSYIRDQEAQARVDRAPANAIFKRDGTWRTFADISDGSDVKHTIATLVKEEQGAYIPPSNTIDPVDGGRNDR